MARPLLVRVGDLLRDPGSRRDLDCEVELELLATSVAAIVEDEPVVITGVIESMPGGLIATGTVTVQWVGECRRCLDAVGGVSDLEFREIWQKDPIDEDILPLDDEELLDLEPLVRELVLSGLPLAPLCRNDCEGPDPERFPTGPAEEPDEPPTDPRWGALADLRFDD